ncbi:alpha/beta fold hydrolase [Phenylobacterium sp.]|uniref:alpha/beta fold hydrolase n=1 Tax=Phenylobacterium sp. TaxID=1871053 RepID=UPI0035B37899
MSLASLTRTDFQSELGVTPLWHAAGAFESAKPVIVTVTGAFAGPDTMSRLPQVMGEACDCFLMHLPGNHTPALRETGVRPYARALEAVIAQAFPDRPVILLGVSIGALVTLAVRAPNVRRVVAVEPPLVMSKLWPMRGPLAEKVAAAPDDPNLRAFADRVFGVTPEAAREVTYFDLFEGLEPPVDVVVGDRPLMPPRTEETYPSFVDTAERDWLGRQPNVVVHVAPAAGHNVPFQAPLFLKAILVEAVARLGPVRPLSANDAALLGRAPVAAERVLYVGAAQAAFAAAYRRRNPLARLEVAEALDAAPAGPFDLVLAESFRAADAGRLAALAAGGGTVLACAAPVDAAALARPPFSMVRLTPPAPDAEAFDDRPVDLWPVLGPTPDQASPQLLALARKAPAATPLFLRLATFAPRLMDVRTRLPAEGLRTDPALRVALCGPTFRVDDIEPEAPKVLVLQRPALVGADDWRKGMAETIRRGWLTVMEADDHPELIAQVTGRPAEPGSWERFAYVHAVQTSTPALAEAFGRYNPEVKIFPNCAFELAPMPEAPAPRRVFYGAVTRGPFAVAVARTLGPVAEAFPEVEWVVIGDRGVFEALPAANKRFLDYMSYPDYLAQMSACAVSLSPVDDNPLQDTKSDLKFVEASARGVVTLASPAIYAATVRHRETGMIARRLEEWAPLLTELLADEPARLAMARRAWRYVRAERMFAGQLPERRRWYQDLWARREALTAGVLDRLPGLREALAR